MLLNCSMRIHAFMAFVGLLLVAGCGGVRQANPDLWHVPAQGKAEGQGGWQVEQRSTTLVVAAAGGGESEEIRYVHRADGMLEVTTRYGQLVVDPATRQVQQSSVGEGDQRVVSELLYVVFRDVAAAPAGQAPVARKQLTCTLWGAAIAFCTFVGCHWATALAGAAAGLDCLSDGDRPARRQDPTTTSPTGPQIPIAIARIEVPTYSATDLFDDLPDPVACIYHPDRRYRSQKCSEWRENAREVDYDPPQAVGTVSSGELIAGTWKLVVEEGDVGGFPPWPGGFRFDLSSCPLQLAADQIEAGARLRLPCGAEATVELVLGEPQPQ